MKKKTISKLKKIKRECQIPWCNAVTFLQEHHIRGRKIHNYTHSSNLVYLCPNCHNEVHWGEIIIEGWFGSTSGKKLICRKKEEKSFSGEDAVVHMFKNKYKAIKK